MKRLYLIDGSGFIFRAYHAIQQKLTRSDGTPVSAVLGFVNMILKLIDKAGSDYVAVIFDAGRQTFRNRIYPEYKAHRPPAPDDLIPQFPLVRAATEALNIPGIELADYEADDLIATYTRLAREQGMEVVIVSSDKDLMQLIGDGVSMYDGMKQKSIGREQVLEKFGVEPEKVRDVLALIGDSSDNIPGVPGIGPKTAAELIGQFGDLEGVLTRTAEVKQEKRRQMLEQNIAQARLSYKLIGLCDTVPLPASLEDLKLRAPDNEKFLKFLREMEFKSLVAKYEQKFGVIPAEARISSSTSTSGKMDSRLSGNANDKIIHTHYELVRDVDSLKRWIAEAKAVGHVAFDTETTSLDAMTAELVGFSLCVEAGKACYVPLAHVTNAPLTASQGNLFDTPSTGSTWVRVEGQIDSKDALALLLPLLSDPGVLKIGHNIKYDMLVLKKYDLRITPIDDTMLLSYSMNAGLHNQNMDALAEKYLGHKTITYDEVTGTGKSRLSFAQVPLEKSLAYAAEDADVTLRLWQVFKPELVAQHTVTLYETIERPLIPVIVEMEARGIKVDLAQLSTLSQDFAKRMAVLEQTIYGFAGQAFNLGSPKQLGEILFEKMGIQGGKKSSKTGSYATGADILEELAEQGHELPARILDWRQLSKLKSTYTDALAQEINPQTGRVHTSFAMAVTTTGRLSSSDPNLQNIPIRSEEGRKIRHAFVADSGNKLISADYSQIELRLLAHIADIPTLKQAFKNGDDIHSITASQMFGVAVNAVNDDLRRKAKTINFGIIYGISAHGLAARLGISRSEAGMYIEAYFNQYPGIKDYMERTKQFAREHGYVVTLYGRKCHVPGINDKMARGFSERAAINAPLQGTAADIIKRAMIAARHALQNTSAHMLLQVHDELVIESSAADAHAIAEKIRHVMENAAHLSVPLTVDTSIGDNWQDAE